MFQVSPGINVTELDLTAGVQTTSLSVGAFVGPFQWGPALDVVNVGSETQLAQLFGKPDASTYEYWFTAQSYLAYSNQLRVVRAISSQALNATAAAKTLTGTVTQADIANTTLVGTGTAFTTELVVGQTLLIDGQTLVVATITNATHLTVASALSAALSTDAVTAYGVLIKNSDHQEDTFSSGASGYGLCAAKYPSDLGQSIKVSLCPSALAFQDDAVAGNVTFVSGNTAVVGVGTAFDTDLIVGDYLLANGETFQVETITNATHVVLASAPTSNLAVSTGSWSRKWEYASQFDAAPGTSPFADGENATNDELHMVVVDALGYFSGVRGQVLERFAFVSKASNAKDVSGAVNYYATVLNRQSAYAWWLAHVSTSTNWGSPASGLTFGAAALPYTRTLVGGNDGNGAIADGDLQTGWDIFADPDQIDVSLLISGPVSPLTTGAYILDNVAEVRKDAVVFLSPTKAAVVNNVGSEVDDIVTDRGAINSSYAVMDSGWKYQYDKYNEVYRWIPLNGDIAGLAARTDTTNDPWWSPAGFTRGTVKNVVKLAWNPKQLDRDDLYKKGINPVVSFPSQGVVLYGDKTLLSRPSAFDRINVRRLFIALEKTISRYAKAQLFEFNDEFTRSSFRNAVEPFLRDVKARRGITDFLVICDSSNNPAEIVDGNQFVGDIYVKPTRAINFIQLNFVAVRSGVSFQEVVGAV